MRSVHYTFLTIFCTGLLLTNSQVAFSGVKQCYNDADPYAAKQPASNVSTAGIFSSTDHLYYGVDERQIEAVKNAQKDNGSKNTGTRFVVSIGPEYAFSQHPFQIGPEPRSIVRSHPSDTKKS